MLDIGVVIPTHPARISSSMTQRAISSALEQTLAPKAICVYNDVNKRGAPYSRQRALEMNSQPWTAFLDSDDWFGPNHLRTLAQAAVEQDADYVYSWYTLVRLGRQLTYDPVFPEGHFKNPWDPENPRQTTITTLVRTDMAKDIGFWAPSDEQEFPDGHRVGEDYNFTLECNKRGKIYHVIKRTWFWSHHGENTSGRPDQGDAV